MSADLVLGSFGEPDAERGLLARLSGGQRAHRDAGRLLVSARRQDLGAALRKRAAENGMQDVLDVARLAQELAAGDQFLASHLVLVVEEFTRQTVHDVRNFAREIGL